jgi:hypothetical protein
MKTLLKYKTAYTNNVSASQSFMTTKTHNLYNMQMLKIVIILSSVIFAVNILKFGKTTNIILFLIASMMINGIIIFLASNIEKKIIYKKIKYKKELFANLVKELHYAVEDVEGVVFYCNIMLVLSSIVMIFK